ncbi:FtsW/RodA/SpoVE family cell cycle protein [Massilia sp. R2A-15]|uniref:FtsW/RodA/SpoVE family cell cycle protein n=1 Tax=Massilia sp. R2A-15 TaxID=3064278 RepID=UPI0027325998|nr:FtsW/RodA/SpoVE family cell cycle protein [Massilia sp. R2A-15]WLI90944.1 FtsW/RodA/SpoVE family cell cycle protein [Massilia sp. R2A-15]
MIRRLHLGGFLVAAIALGVLCALQLVALWRSPAVMSPALIALSLKPGESITLGRQELAAPQADRAHVGIRRDLAGRWFARNVSGNRQLLLQRDGSELRTGTIALREGQQFRIGGALFTVQSGDDHSVAFAGAGQRWRYDGATLQRDGRALPPCPDARLGARVAALWNRWAPRTMTFARPLSFGGNLYCDNRLGLEHIEIGAATLGRSNGRLLLASGGGTAPMLVASGAGSFDLARNEVPLDGVTALVAGHTRLAIRIANDRLEFRPVGHVALFLDARVELPPQVQWEWGWRRPWALSGGPAWLLALVLCGALAATGALAWQRGRWPFERGVAPATRAASFATVLLAIAGIAALVLQRAGTPPGVGVSILLGCAAMWCCLMLPGRPSLVTAAGVLLLAVGLLAQLELGLGAMESSWLRHYQKSTALLAIGLGIGAHLRLRLGGRAFVMPQTRLEWMLALLACGALAALLLQVVLGDETGVFDLQPVEFAKLALTALTAHCIALGLGWDAALPAHIHPVLRWFRLAAPALLFLALLGLALVQVDDYSPLILLLVWSMAMAFAWSLAARKYLATAAIVGLACGAAASIAWLRGAGAGEVSQWTFYADRFLVWLDPASHPHTGQQLLLGARAIAEGAWWGSDQLLGISSLGQPAGSALHIPQVQDDFAPSFFVNRHGLAGALALWMLQALFLVGVLQTAARSYAASVEARDFRHAWMGRFRCFALCGGAAFVLGHFLLSWGTNLAIFPIMGQPMSFLSAGGSHLLFFICPLLAFSAISAQSSEEIQSCRSMSNTKC